VVLGHIAKFPFAFLAVCGLNNPIMVSICRFFFITAILPDHPKKKFLRPAKIKLPVGHIQWPLLNANNFPSFNYQAENRIEVWFLLFCHVLTCY